MLEVWSSLTYPGDMLNLSLFIGRSLYLVRPCPQFHLNSAASVEQHQASHLFLGLHLLLPGWVNSVDHPLDGEVGDRTKYSKTEQQADNFIPTNRAGDIFCWNLSQHHHQMTESTT